MFPSGDSTGLPGLKHADESGRRVAIPFEKNTCLGQEKSSGGNFWKKRPKKLTHQNEKENHLNQTSMFGGLCWFEGFFLPLLLTFWQKNNPQNSQLLQLSNSSSRPVEAASTSSVLEDSTVGQLGQPLGLKHQESWEDEFPGKRVWVGEW